MKRLFAAFISMLFCFSLLAQTTECTERNICHTYYEPDKKESKKQICYTGQVAMDNGEQEHIKRVALCFPHLKFESIDVEKLYGINNEVNYVLDGVTTDTIAYPGYIKIGVQAVNMNRSTNDKCVVLKYKICFLK